MRALSAAAAIAAFLLLAGCHPNLTTAPGERVWEGEITVSRGEEVKEGERLVIRPGTRVIFPFYDDDSDGWGDSGILVRGTIVARGTEREPILFEPERRDDKPGLWGSIRIESGGMATFSHCRFRGAQWALHVHFTPLTVEASRFAGNVGGVKFRGGPIRIYSNDFTGNGTAVRYWESDPEIISNIFRENGTALFCREGSKRSLLRGNNFLGSVDYHIKLGELQEEDVDARYNYWGTGRAAQIEEKLYDRGDVAYLGRVLYDPPEERPFPLDDAWSSPGERSGRPRRAGETVPPGRQ